jgi:RNA polymerase sigma factor (sigma-70 family)
MENDRIVTDFKPAEQVKVERWKVTPEVKKYFASVETSRDIDGDWLQLEPSTFKDLQDRGKISKDITFDEIKTNPEMYDVAAEGYINDLKDTFGIKDIKDAALWSYRPGYYKKYDGDIDKIPDDKKGSFGKSAKDVMKQRKGWLEKLDNAITPEAGASEIPFEPVEMIQDRSPQFDAFVPVGRVGKWEMAKDSVMRSFAYADLPQLDLISKGNLAIDLLDSVGREAFDILKIAARETVREETPAGYFMASIDTLPPKERQKVLDLQAEKAKGELAPELLALQVATDMAGWFPRKLGQGVRWATTPIRNGVAKLALKAGVDEHTALGLSESVGWLTEMAGYIMISRKIPAAAKAAKKHGKAIAETPGRLHENKMHNFLRESLIRKIQDSQSVDKVTAGRMADAMTGGKYGRAMYEQVHQLTEQELSKLTAEQVQKMAKYPKANKGVWEKVGKNVQKGIYDNADKLFEKIKGDIVSTDKRIAEYKGSGTKIGKGKVSERDVLKAINKYVESSLGVKGGKTPKFNKLLREQQGKPPWEALTPKQQFTEFRDYALRDFEVAMEEMSDPVDYMLDRALDPLDPMSEVYKLILIKHAGAEITETGGIRLPKELQEAYNKNHFSPEELLPPSEKPAIEETFTNGRDTKLLDYLARYMSPQDVARLTDEQRLELGNDYVKLRDYASMLEPKDPFIGVETEEEMEIEEQTPDPTIIPEAKAEVGGKVEVEPDDDLSAVAAEIAELTEDDLVDYVDRDARSKIGDLEGVVEGTDLEKVLQDKIKELEGEKPESGIKDEDVEAKILEMENALEHPDIEQDSKNDLIGGLGALKKMLALKKKGHKLSPEQESAIKGILDEPITLHKRGDLDDEEYWGSELAKIAKDPRNITKAERKAWDKIYDEFMVANAEQEWENAKMVAERIAADRGDIVSGPGEGKVRQKAPGDVKPIEKPEPRNIKEASSEEIMAVRAKLEHINKEVRAAQNKIFSKKVKEGSKELKELDAIVRGEKKRINEVLEQYGLTVEDLAKDPNIFTDILDKAEKKIIPDPEIDAPTPTEDKISLKSGFSIQKEGAEWLVFNVHGSLAGKGKTQQEARKIAAELVKYGAKTKEEVTPFGPKATTKEVRDYFTYQVTEALKTAKSETVYLDGKRLPRAHGKGIRKGLAEDEIKELHEMAEKLPKITIAVPGGPTYILNNTAEALSEALERAKKITSISKPSTGKISTKQVVANYKPEDEFVRVALKGIITDGRIMAKADKIPDKAKMHGLEDAEPLPGDKVMAIFDSKSAGKAEFIHYETGSEAEGYGISDQPLKPTLDKNVLNKAVFQTDQGSYIFVNQNHMLYFKENFKDLSFEYTANEKMVIIKSDGERVGVMLSMETERKKPFEKFMALPSAEKAFNDLEQHRQKLRAMVGAKLGRGTSRAISAEDIVQEAYLKAWISIQSGTEYSGSGLHWMRVIAQNVMANYFGREWKMGPGKERSFYGEPSESGEALESPEVIKVAFDKAREAEEILENKIKISRVKEALSNLPADQQLAISMMAEGYRQREIAQQLGVSEDTVYTWFRRNKAMLQRMVKFKIGNLSLDDLRATELEIIERDRKNLEIVEEYLPGISPHITHVGALFHPDGRRALGKFTSGEGIKIVHGAPTVTYFHEGVHLFLDINKTAAEKQSAFDEIRQKEGNPALDNEACEEVIAEVLWDYAQWKRDHEAIDKMPTRTWSEKFQKFIARLFDFINGFFIKQPKNVKRLYDEMLSKKAAIPRDITPKEDLDVGDRFMVEEGEDIPKGYGTVQDNGKPVKKHAPISDYSQLDKELPERLDLIDELLKITSPAARRGVELGSSVIRKHISRLAYKDVRTYEAFKQAHRAFQWMKKEDVFEFIDNMESGKQQKTPKLQKISEIFRKALDDRRKEVQALGKGRLEHFYKNYFPHIWKNPRRAEDVIARIMGRKRLEGSKSFLKERSIMSIKEGIEKGLELVSENPVDLVALKIHEMDRYIMAQDLIKDLKERNMLKFVYSRGTPKKGWIRINDNAFTVFMPPFITKKEAYDVAMVDQMLDVARSLGIDTKRFVNIGTGGLGWAMGTYGQSGGEVIRTKFASPEQVLAHEIGHVLGYRYKLYDTIRRTDEGEWKDIKKGKKAGEKKWAPDEEAVEWRKKIDEEWRALVDLKLATSKYKDAKPTDYFQKYIRKAREKEAAMLEAMIHAPEQFKKVAPELYKAFRTFLNNHAELRPILDIEPSMILGESDAIIKVPGFTTIGYFTAPEPIGTILNNYLSPGIKNAQNKIISGSYNIIRGVGNLLNQVNLALSAFHALNVTADMIGGTLGLGIRKMTTRGQMLSGIKDVLTFPISPIPIIWNGMRIKKAYRKGIENITDPRLRAIVEHTINAGGRERMDPFYYNAQLKALEGTFREIFTAPMLNKLSAAARLPINILGSTLEVIAKPLMEWYVPTGKMGIFAKMAEHELQRAADGQIDEDQLMIRLMSSWDSVDNRMGQLVYDNLFWNRYLKDMLMLLIRSVGWNLGSWREFAGAGVDLMRWRERIKNGDLFLSEKMVYAAGVMIVYALFGAVATWLLTGKYPHEWGEEGLALIKDYMFPRTGKRNPDGSWERLSPPFYSKEVYMWATRPVESAAAKAHPLISLTGDLVKNKDFFGVEIRHTDDPAFEQLKQAAKYIADYARPISFKNWEKMNKTDPDSKWENLAISITGITSAPGYISRTRAQKLTGRYLSERIPAGSRTKAEFEKSEYRKQMITRLRKGEKVSFSEAKQVLGEKSFNLALNDALKEPFAASFNRLTAKEAVNVFLIANKEEKEQSIDLLKSKVDRYQDQFSSDEIRDIKQMVREYSQGR